MVETPCGEHAWASIGVTMIDEAPSRIWMCEVCRAWSSERLDPADEIPWASTVLSEE